jgi:2-polyprenyl-3-methyl-5-hydroxy-6-metoxy-1,4-benzoquinol methylase
MTSGIKLRYGLKAGGALMESGKYPFLSLATTNVQNDNVLAGPTGGIHPVKEADLVRTFIEHNRAGFVKTLYHRFLKRTTFLSDFDINGKLDIYPLHLFSSGQLAQFFDGRRFDRCLDIGAGRGSVTTLLQRHCDKPVIATEMSVEMAQTIEQQFGISCWKEDIAETVDTGRRDQWGTFNLISMLNVLDRTSKPASLLHAANKLLHQGGFVLIASPLPFRPFYFKSPSTSSSTIAALFNQSNKFGRPLESLAFPIVRIIDHNDAWELQAKHFLDNVLPEHGFGEVVAFSRIPYVSGGDFFSSCTVLDDILVLAKKTRSHVPTVSPPAIEQRHGHNKI